ncbi:FtsB family cell division protein [Pontibacillus marinus]|uniref:Cell division protein n=1 Tax=Pontibacillus marinus BH030004 = DSM 16465 TaxID=1385511 RepID=A0A0A5FXD6_9BACI|nr:septum formation initiator family protein [Pontibacillus marinus]KGX83480.1 cell division protein [Pontibacillus marinus BH030004 = DSM 16465]
MANHKSVAKIDSGYVQQYDAYMKRQQKKKKRLVRRLALFALVTLLLFGSLLTYHLKQRSLLADKQQEYQQLQEDMQQLNKKESDLKEEIQLLQDEEYVLQIARTNYFFSKEGEIIFKLPDNGPSY